MGVRVQLEKLMDAMKEEKGYKSDTDLTADDLKKLCDQYKAKVKEVLGAEFPDDAKKQLWGGVGAVFKSWNGKRACSYRRIEGIPDELGNRHERAVDGLWQHGCDLGHGRGFQPQPGHRREQVLRRMADQRPGRRPSWPAFARPAR